MLWAYYDKTCDSHELFHDYSIADDPSYEKHLNKYDVLYLDMTLVMGEAGKENIIDFIKEKNRWDKNTIPEYKGGFRIHHHTGKYGWE